MRLYIGHISSSDQRKPEFKYDFTESIEDSWQWDKKESAELQLTMILTCGIAAESPGPFRKSAQCTAFQIEPRPQGGFAISCEHPFSGS